MSTLPTCKPWPADVARRLDDICLRFEDAWRTAGPNTDPRVEDFLDGASPSEWPLLLRELVGLDADYRSRRGEAPAVDDYQRRFPDLDLAWLRAPPPSDATRDWPRAPAERESQTPLDDGIPPAEPLRHAPGSPSVPGYEILGVLGKGAMGVVYQARQTDLARIVALKMILAGGHADAARRERFRVEAQAIARLQHPNIVQVFEVGENDGLPFFSLEYCAAGSLAAKLGGTPLPPRETAWLLETLARAMHAAHLRGIIHRDLKPANILLTCVVRDPSSVVEDQDGLSLTTDHGPRTTDWIPKITDFGLAKMLDQSGMSLSDAIMGTPSYMPPEQADPRLGEPGPLSDVYALGAILYECLTGRPPFKGATPLDTIAQLIANEAVPPRQLNTQVPADLETICLKCLQKEPARRYASAEALADDLRRFQNGEPIVARRVGLVERGVKYARRKPWVVGAWALGIAAALFLVAFGGYYLYRQNLDLEAELVRQKELEDKRVRALTSAAAAENALKKADWPAVVAAANQTLDRIGEEPALADLAEHARRLQAAAETVLAFAGHRDRAMYHAVLAMEEVDQAAHRRAVREAAGKALVLFGLSDDGPPALPQFRGARFTPETQRWLTERCYELYLTWAVVLSPGKNDNPAERRVRAEQALRMLDRAAHLGLPTRSEHERRAALLLTLGDVAGAEKAQERTRGLEPSLAVDHFLLGMDSNRTGELDRAAGHFKTVLMLQPDHFWASYCQAACYLRTRRSARALAPLTACIQMNPKFAWSYILRGFLNGELRDFDAADADFAAAEKLADDDLARYGLRVNRAAVRLLQGVNHFDDAVADLDRAVELRPQQPQAYAMLADVHRRRGRPNEALVQLHKAIKLAPSAELFQARAELHALLDADNEALADLKESIRRWLDAGNLANLAGDEMQRGRILVKLQKYDPALEAFDNALAARPDLVDVHRLRGETLLHLERIPQAAEALDRYLAKGRPSARASRARALCRAKLENYVGAIEDYSRALEIDRLEGAAVDPETLAFRGWAYLALQVPTLAVRDFEQALALHGDNRGDCLAGRGYARVLLGRWQDAVADAEAAIKEGTPPARTYYNAARTYAQAAAKMQADPQRRRLCVQRALELLGVACAKTEAGKRAAFWRDYVEVDPALQSISRTDAFQHMRIEFARPAKEAP